MRLVHYPRGGNSNCRQKGNLIVANQGLPTLAPQLGRNALAPSRRGADRQGGPLAWPPNLHHGRLELLHARYPRVATALRSARQPASGLRFPSGPPAGPLSRRHGFAARDTDIAAPDSLHIPRVETPYCASTRQHWHGVPCLLLIT